MLKVQRREKCAGCLLTQSGGQANARVVPKLGRGLRDPSAQNPTQWDSPGTGLGSKA